MEMGILILAAGNSSRMGQAKQILKFNGKTLLQSVIDEAVSTSLGPVVVVLGAYVDEIVSQTDLRKVQYVVNEQWESGMASSIVKGLTHILNVAPQLTGVLITVADQPFLNATQLIALTNCFNPDDPVPVASKYQHTIGTPVLFPKAYFPNLLALTGDKGAKSVLQSENEVKTVGFDLGGIDIDTKGDYDALKGN